MTATITLHVYSGRPNPAWRLSSQDEASLEERLRSLNELSFVKPSGVGGGLGYRGFSISRSPESPSGMLSAHIHEGIVDSPAGAPNYVDNTGLEQWLLERAPQDVDVGLREHVSTALRRSRIAPLMTFNVAAAGCPPVVAVDSPAYNPAIWNVPTVQPYNNCYNYANNNATNTFAQPGKASGHPATAMACSHVDPAAQSDGLRAVGNFSTSLAAGAGWYVALVVWPNRDYHWYRQDSVGCWSHKPGQTAARNTDNAGKAISDPKTCDRGPYSDFCTYMVTNRSVQIK